MEKSICKIKNGKASGPSGVVTEMLKLSFDICSELIADRKNSMICENRCKVNGITVLLSVYSKVKVKLQIDVTIAV